MKTLLLRYTRTTLLSLPLLVLPLARAQDKPADAPAFDVGRLQAGQFTYRMVVDGKKVGTVGSRSGRVMERATMISPVPLISRRTSRATNPALERVASSQMKRFPRHWLQQWLQLRVRIRNQYLAGRATGFAISHGTIDKSRRLPVDSAVPADTVDQRIDWAA